MPAFKILSWHHLQYSANDRMLPYFKRKKKRWYQVEMLSVKNHKRGQGREKTFHTMKLVNYFIQLSYSCRKIPLSDTQTPFIVLFFHFSTQSCCRNRHIEQFQRTAKAYSLSMSFLSLIKWTYRSWFELMLDNFNVYLWICIDRYWTGP